MSLAMIQSFKGIEGTPPQRLVGYMLADAHNDKTNRCDLAISSLVRLTGLCERAVQKSIHDLECNGHLTREYRTGTSTQYHLHPRIACTPTDNKPPHVVHPPGACGAPPPPHVVHPIRKGTGSKPSATPAKPKIAKVVKEKPAPAPDPRHQEFISLFHTAWATWNHGEKYIIQGRDVKSLQTFLKATTKTADELMKAVIWCWERLAEAADMSPREIKSTTTIFGFVTNYSALVVYANNYRETRPRR